jgi:hypothetical protein
VFIILTADEVTIKIPSIKARRIKEFQDGFITRRKSRSGTTSKSERPPETSPKVVGSGILIGDLASFAKNCNKANKSLLALIY